MSMPKFPDINPEITCESALNMILASIAMEEVALSHVINAEGEKIQYVLGTLETNSGNKPDVDEVLKVNQSVTRLMDSISQFQMILKSKMDKALYALSEICPEQPKPPCPPCPPCPPGPCPPCPPEPCPCPPGPTGPTGPPGPPGKCPCKCSAVFKAAEKCKIWCLGTSLHWNTVNYYGGCICTDSYDKTKIELYTKGRFMINFSVNVRAKRSKCNAAISLQMVKYQQHINIYTVKSYIPNGDDSVTISMSGIIVENFDHGSFLSFKLESPDSLTIEDSMLSIIEI